MEEQKTDTAQDILHVVASIKTSDGRVLAVDQNLAEMSKVVSDIAGLSDAIAAGPGLFAYWSMLETYAVDDENVAKDELDRWEQVALADLGGGKDDKVTAMKAAVRARPEYVERHARWRDAQRTAAIIKVGRRTCEERRDAVRELAQLLRSEMQVLLGSGGVTGSRDLTEAAERAAKKMLRVKRERKGS